MVFDHNGIKLKLSNRKIKGKSLNSWELNNTLLNNLSQRSLKGNENKNKTYQKCEKQLKQC